MYMASFTFLLVHCGSLVSTLVLSSETECPVALQWSPTMIWYGQVGVFLEAFSKWAFGFTYVLLLPEQFPRKKTSRDLGF